MKDTAVVLYTILLCLCGLPILESYYLIEPVVGPVQIDTPYGRIEGLTYRNMYEAWPYRLTNVFLGVPYTKTLKQHGSEWREKYRFHNPDEDPFWYGTYDATKHKPACPQMPWLVKETVWNFTEVDEDCLYLDIYTPNITNEMFSNNPVLYPVLVFFHGGGFIMGTSKQWPGVFLSQRNIVVVIVNYRLNALGFLSTGDRYSVGNYGMFDQIKALQFVKKTIRSFRGNPQKVTIMGHSAGGASVGMHILSPRSVDLFNQAIMLGGSELSEWAVIPPDDAKLYARRLCIEVGCPYGDSQQMVDCLRHQRTFQQIVNASAMIPMVRGKIGNPWGPVVDGDIVGATYAFLPQTPYDLRRQGVQRRVRLLAGMTQDEGAYFIPNLPNLIDGITPQQYENILHEFIRYRDVEEKNPLFDAMKYQYTYWPQPTNISFVRKKVIEMMSDYLFGAAMSESIRWHVQFATVYFYVFQYSSWNNYIPPWRGISHGQDLDYIFGLPFINETYMDLLGVYPRQLYDYSDRNISEYMINMITNFTSTGEPTPRTEPIRFFRNVSWYEYNTLNHSYLSINNRSANRENYRQTEVHFWNDYYPILAGYSPYYFKPKTGGDTSSANTYELTTWALTAVGGVLLLVVICLVVLLIVRSRTKKYPKYNDNDSNRDDRSFSPYPEKDRRTEISYFEDDDYYNNRPDMRHPQAYSVSAPSYYDRRDNGPPPSRQRDYPDSRANTERRDNAPRREVPERERRDYNERLDNNVNSSREVNDYPTYQREANPPQTGRRGLGRPPGERERPRNPNARVHNLRRDEEQDFTTV